MIKPSYPGVYINEQRSGVQTISGVATSVAAFVGTSPKGPINEPVRIFNFDDFEARFGNGMTHGEMPIQVRQFFMNGGGTAWITRVAKDPKKAVYDMVARDGTALMTLTAKDAGLMGNLIQIDVDYNTSNPERFFNLTLYRRFLAAGGIEDIQDVETYSNLSMDPASPQFVETAINGRSNLVEARINSGLMANAVARTSDYCGSIPGWFFKDAASLRKMIKDHGQGNINVSVGYHPPVEVIFYDPVLDDDMSNAPKFNTYRGNLKSRIETALNMVSLSATISVDKRTLETGFETLVISAGALPIVITSAASNDVAGAMRLGVGNAGIETDKTTVLRPVPTGVTTFPHSDLPATNSVPDFKGVIEMLKQDPSKLDEFTLATGSETFTFNATPITSSTNFASNGTPHPIGEISGSFSELLENLSLLAQSISTGTPASWSVSRYGSYLSASHSSSNAALGAGGSIATDDTTLGPVDNIFAGHSTGTGMAYVLGSAGPAFAGSEGTMPSVGEYDDAYGKLIKASDIFNIVVLPRANVDGVPQTDADRANLWGPASAMCRDRRAFLVMDPPGDNDNVWESANSVDAGIQAIRMGVVGDHAALYWPKMKVSDDDGKIHIVDPGGSIAGIYARTDGTRGVWKAPAGLTAGITGIRGLQHRITDDENGVTNLLAVNTNREFAQGAVCWGARTLAGFENSGESDWNHVPVRRLALMIEESLYRGLKFAVFEPNAEPLWAQIRLAAGSFMNNLFRQGAFKGTKSTDAYFVACDASTTRQNDINLGIVNVKVGFAPLKPAEFIIVHIKQLAGQIDV